MSAIRLEDILVNKNSTIRDTLAKLNIAGINFVICVDENRKLEGIIAAFDMRRAFMNDARLNDPIDGFLNKNPKVLNLEDRGKGYRQKLIDLKKAFAPIVNDQNIVVDYINININKFDYCDDIRNKYFSDKIEQNSKLVVITGGAGYIGAHLVEILLEKGCFVRVVDMLAYNINPLEEFYSYPRFEFIYGDITNIKTLSQSFLGATHLVHLAAVVGDPACAVDADSTIDINYLATKAVVEVAKEYRIPHFYFASSCSVYGVMDESEELLTEKSKLNPVSLYAETRLRSEDVIMRSASSDFNPIILRFGTAFGHSRRMRFDLVVNKLIADAYYNGKINIYAGESWRPFVHCRDIAKVVARFIFNNLPENHVFNVGAHANNLKLDDIADIVKEVVPSVEVIRHPTDSSDIRNYRVNFSRLEKYLGDNSFISVKEACLDMLKRFKKQNYEDYMTNGIYSNKMCADKKFLSFV